VDGSGVSIGYVLDHSALAALGAGSRALSRMVQTAHESGEYHIYVPALCLLAATATRPAIADHVGSLPGLDVVELDYPAAAATGRLVAKGIDWRLAHAIHVGRPTADWLRGRPVVTGTPQPYAGQGVAVVPIR
jgi:hypothetical protein